MYDGLDLLVGASLDRSSLDPAARRVAEAAFQGWARPDDALDSADVEQPVTAPPDDVATRPQVWLTGVRVEGFRGVAGELSLPLLPQPGLVLVVGRNGAGKSSVAEGAEIALAGGSERSSSALWSEGLRNLHHQGPASVGVSLRVDAGPDVVVSLVIDGDRLDGSAPTATRSGVPYDLAGLGWADAVARFRPVLTYGELAALSSSKPSALHDPLNRILGLEPLTTADSLLRDAERRLAQPGKDASTARAAARTALPSSDDERAAALREALSGKNPDTTAARALLDSRPATDSTGSGRAVALAALTTPEPADARGKAEALGLALYAYRSATAGQAGRANRLGDLLALAIEHRDGPEDRCPVCGQGRLDDAWLEQARTETARQREVAAEATRAATGLRTASTAARQLVTPVPAVLRQDSADGLHPSAALAAWEAWAALAEADVDDRTLVDRLPAAAETLQEQVAQLAAQASEALEAQDRRWRPLADQAREAVRLTEEAAALAPRLAAVKAARAWLKGASDEIRNDRLRPFADQATGIWAALRQESNVALSGVTLTGQNTRRDVQLDLQVDGEAGTRAVLSQGELAALGLALFLPRSVAAESPFRFVVVDDPVQSLDPSKVDGLARVLHALGSDRQVVVFTHDDRLVKSLRHLDLSFTGYRLARGERSAVTAEPMHDPVEQHLRDADALAKDTVLPADLLALSVTGYCRDAIEEAALEVARQRLTADGKTVAEAEQAIEATSTTRARLALALLGDCRAKQMRQLDGKLADLGADNDVVTLCVEGVHVPPTTDLSDLRLRTERFVEALRSGS